MKIGQFAAKHGTSIDTIRHYISLGLLIPEKNNTQYEFDEMCSYDFLQISALKKIGFTLNEIQQLILYRRIGKLTEYDQRSTYTSFFEKKVAHIDQEIDKLVEMKINLKNAIDDMKEQDKLVVSETMGLELSALSLFACPICHAPYEISEGSIHQGLLINAQLTCPCKHQLRVEDGIVYTTETLTSKDAIKSQFDLSGYSEQFIDAYINTTHVDYLKKLHAGLMWSTRHMTPESFQNQVALELGSGHGYFMRHMLDLFPESSTYIAVDHNPIKLIWLKKIIERSHPKCTVIFLCADFTSLPLKSDSVDVLLDISGSSNYAFDHPEFLLELIDPLLKRDVKLHGYYILFDNFVSKSKVPLELRDNFKLQQIKTHLKQLEYRCDDDFTSETVEKGGPLEDYFIEGERVRTYLYSGKKVIKPLG